MTARGEARMIRRREAAKCPDVGELRRLLIEASGIDFGSQKRLADMVGVLPTTIGRWEKGSRVPHVYVAKLVDVETKLKARIAPSVEAPRSERSLPLMANAVDVRVEGEQALVRFALKIPGDDAARSVAEILVPKALLTALRIA